jgi:hypothetical protein
MVVEFGSTVSGVSIAGETSKIGNRSFRSCRVALVAARARMQMHAESWTATSCLVLLKVPVLTPVQSGAPPIRRLHAKYHDDRR